MESKTAFKPKLRVRVRPSTSVSVLWGIVAATAVWLLLRQYRALQRSRPKREVITSIREKWQHMLGLPTVITGAYTKFNQATFHYTTFRGRKQVVVCSSELIAELKSAPMEAMSFTAWTQELLQCDIIFPLWSGGVRTATLPPFVSRVTFRWYKGAITKDLPKNFPFIRESVGRQLTYELVRRDGPVHDVARNGIVGVIARFLVGEKLSRDPEFLKMLLEVSQQIAYAGPISSMFPQFLKSTAVKYLTRLDKTTSFVSQKLHARADAEAGQPHEDFDFFSFGLTALERNHEESWTVDRLITETFVNIFAAFHTTSMAFAVFLIEIATRPDCQKILREEAQAIIAKKGWTMEAIDSMWILDSFMRETRRTRPHSDVLLNRLVMRPTTLSDGTYLAPGTHIGAAYAPRESDPRYYASPATFDPLRFYTPRINSPDPSHARFTSTDVESNEHLGFGGGKNPCPGRFFAMATIKTALVQLLLEYELTPGSDKMEYVCRFEEHQLPSYKDRVRFRRL